MGTKLRLAIVVGVALSAACASDDPVGDDAGIAPPESTTTPSTVPVTTAPATTTPATTEPEPTVVDTTVPDTTMPDTTVPEIDSDPATYRTLRTAAMGGLDIMFDPAWYLNVDSDAIGIRRVEPGGKAWRQDVIVALVTESTANGPVRSIDEFIAHARSVPGAAVAESGTTWSGLGLDFTGYSFRASAGSGSQPIFLNRRFGTSTTAGAWTPFPFGELFLAESGNGVVVLGASGATVEDLAVSRQMLELISVELLGTVNDAEVDLDAFVGPIDGERPTPDEPTPGIPVLEEVFAPMSGTTQQSVNLGDTVVFTPGENWWVQPNFTGYVVFTAPASFGPLNDGLTMLVDVVGGQLADEALRPVGDPIDLRDIRAFVDDPPDPLVVSDVEDVDVGGRDAVRFDIAFADDVDCSDSAPCVFMVWTDFGLVQQFRVGHATTVWWIDGEQSPIMVRSSSVDDDFVQRAAAVVDSFEFVD